jgi:catechol 2,3-dioxygenase-like lactoylglutathione lyase family enzyme
VNRAARAGTRSSEVTVLSDKNVAVTIPVKDLEVARAFYHETLGLRPADAEEEGVLSYRSGSGTVLVYESEFAGTNKATAATWEVGDVEREVRVLKDRGVRFEHYDDLPETTRRGDVHVTGSMKAAWFKDPDGNIHAIVGP